MASCFDAGLSPEEVEEELAFRRSLLDTVDETSRDPETSRSQLRGEIEAFEQQLDQLTSLQRTSSNAAGSVASRPTTSASNNSFVHTTDAPLTPIDDDGGELDLLRAYGSPTESGSGSASVVHADSLPALSSPSVDLPSRKRQRDSIGPLGRLKSRRPTPSPAITAATTPTSLSSEDWEASKMRQFLGSDAPDDIEEMRREQLENEELLRQRKEQEMRDAEFARQLQDSWDEEVPSSASQPAPSSQAVLDFSQGARFRKMPPPPAPTIAVKAEGSKGHPWASEQANDSRSSSFSRFDQKFGEPAWSHASSKPTPVKGEFRPQNGYHDISSDSDLEEIRPSQFRANNSRSPLRQRNRNLKQETRPHSSSSNQSWGDVEVIDAISSPSARAVPAPTPSFAVPPGYTRQPDLRYPSADAASFGNLFGAAGNHLRNLGSNVTNGALALLDQHIGSFGSPSTGYASPGMGNGSRYNYGGSGLMPGGYPVGSQYMPALGSVYSNGTSANPLNLDDHRERNPELYDYYTNDPTKTTEELKALLENIRPDQDLPPENREGTPEAMKYKLMEHQKLGLTWMKSMEEGSNKGGILADDMGLGKTIQALALMVSRPSTDRSRKTTLIVAPVALMQQWKREIDKMLRSSHKLSVHIMHGDRAKMSVNMLKTYDVVMTTYGILGSELKRKHAWQKKLGEHPNLRPSGKDGYFPVLDTRWYRVILDEAQCIKNKDTKAALAAAQVQSEYRWCLSGTPMQNGPHELFSLIHFLRIRPYNELTRFNKDFTKPLKGNYQGAKDRAMQQLQALLKAILLRRTKKSEIDGQPILQLPARSTTEEHTVFSQDEKDFYTALETQTQLQFNKYLKKGTVGRNYSNILTLLLRLRQACCHPLLIRDHGIAVGSVSEDIDMIANAKELAPEVVNRLLEIESFDCPICMDAVEQSLISNPCGHSTCSECWARLTDPAQLIAQGEDGTHGAVKCPSCRTRLDPKKVTDLVSFNKVFRPGETGNDAAESDRADEAEVSGSESESDDEEEEDVDDDDSLRDFIDDDDSDNKKDAEAKGEKKPRKRKNRKGKGKARDKKPEVSLAQLKKEGMRNVQAKRKYLAKLRKDWLSSTKIDKTIEILEATAQNGEGEKTIIFSQFTTLLDLLEVAVSDKEFGYTRYDGSMTPAQRNDAVIAFTDNPHTTVMLVSLKAGNSGLNLVAANHVVIFDPFWNPYIEEQAIDRAHRIGQMKPVHVHRILVENTVEDRILALQEKKRQVIESALDENASKNIARLGVNELSWLFGITDRVQ